jgi:basic membrane lipoprotein Med (substrate-binding protein (PBP1-ABC) superfamily)
MIEVRETGTVYRNPRPELRSRHTWHPTVVRFDDGEMLVTFDIAEADVSLDYGTYATHSSDGGGTWSAPSRVFASAVIDLAHAFLLVAAEVQSDHFPRRARVFGLGDGVVSYVPNPLLDSLIPESIKARMKAARDSLIAGTLIAAPRPPTMDG